MIEDIKGGVKYMYENLEQLMENRVFYNFQKISEIPRCNGDEQRISDYLFQWAKDHNLNVIQDKALNIIIKKPASYGYENAPPVIIQAHMDMVCDKEPDSSHDFSCDPIRLKLNGDKLFSAGGTSLGADNGIGVALCLAILEADSIPHPSLEILFTTEEETNMKGALSVDSSNFTAKYLINLDHAVDNEVLSGGCGGVASKMHIPLIWQSTPRGLKSFSLQVKGLVGGHSGEDIHRGIGNANILLCRLLYAFKQEFHFWLADLKGGSQRAALPRESETIILVSEKDISNLERISNNLFNCFQKELGATSPNLEVVLKPVDNIYEQVFDDTMLDKIFAVYFLTPNGIQEMNGLISHVVESSNNFAIVDTKKTELVFTNEIRGSFASTKYLILNRIEVLAKLLNGTITSFDDYPEWTYNANSPLRDLAIEVYKQVFNEELKVLVVHAGIESGALISRMPFLDVISIGPNCYYFHSPNECVSVSSTDKVWHFLKAILENIR